MEIKISVEELRKRKLMVCTPCYGGMNATMYTKSMSDLSSMCVKYGIQLQQYYLSNESLIPRGRAYCCDEFLRSDCTHMIFIDSDIGFDAKDVISLLALQSDESEYDVIGAVYPKKAISWEKIKTAVDKGLANDNPNDLERYIGDFVFNPKAGTSSFRVDQPVEVMELGTGFMMIRRKTFDVYKANTPTLSYRPDHVRTTNFDGSREIHMYFDCAIDRGYSFQEMHDLVTEVSTSTDVADLGKLNQKAKEMLAKETTASKRYLSEDYKFCQDVSNFGMKIWLCPWIKLSHVGTYVFSGGLADMAVAGTAATASFEELQKAKDSDKAKQKFTDRISKPKQ